jgi:YVTN family beta-propeller protein
MENRRSLTLWAVLALLASSTILPGQATRLPADTRKLIQEIFPAGNLRLDGSVELPDRNLLLPLIPSSAFRRAKNESTWKYPPNSAEPDLIVYENGWVHFKTDRKGPTVTLKWPDGVPDAVKKRILGMKLPGDLIVPNGFVLPKSMQSIIGDLNIPLVEDVALMKPDLSRKLHFSSGTQKEYKGAGTFALVSIKDGTIVLLDGNTFNKISDFPTEGTLCGMSYLDGKLIVADQAKSRVLVLDAINRKFLGQIELPPNTAPKGIVALPDGKSIYVSLSGSSEIAVIDTESGKVFAKAKVPIGPSRMAVTPDGVYVALISVTAAELSVISTYNQRVIGTVKLGSGPTGLVIHPAEKIAYVSNRYTNTVSVVDLSKRTVLNTIKTGTSPTGLAISNDGTKLYVAHGRDNTILVFDTRTYQKLHEIKLPLDVDFPHNIALTPDGKHLIVTSQQTDTIGVMDTTTLEFIKQTQLGHTSQEIIWMPAG